VEKELQRVHFVRSLKSRVKPDVSINQQRRIRKKEVLYKDWSEENHLSSRKEREERWGRTGDKSHRTMVFNLSEN